MRTSGVLPLSPLHARQNHELPKARIIRSHLGPSFTPNRPGLSGQCRTWPERPPTREHARALVASPPRRPEFTRPTRHLRQQVGKFLGHLIRQHVRNFLGNALLGKNDNSAASAAASAGARRTEVAAARAVQDQSMRSSSSSIIPGGRFAGGSPRADMLGAGSGTARPVGRASAAARCCTALPPLACGAFAAGPCSACLPRAPAPRSATTSPLHGSAGLPAELVRRSAEQDRLSAACRHAAARARIARRTWVPYWHAPTTFRLPGRGLSLWLVDSATRRTRRGGRCAATMRALCKDLLAGRRPAQATPRTPALGDRQVARPGLDGATSPGGPAANSERKARLAEQLQRVDRVVIPASARRRQSRSRRTSSTSTG